MKEEINALQQEIEHKLTDNIYIFLLTDNINKLQTQNVTVRSPDSHCITRRVENRCGRSDDGHAGADMPDTRKDNRPQGEIKEQYSNLWHPRRHGRKLHEQIHRTTAKNRVTAT